MYDNRLQRRPVSMTSQHMHATGTTALMK